MYIVETHLSTDGMLLPGEPGHIVPGQQITSRLLRERSRKRAGREIVPAVLAGVRNRMTIRSWSWSSTLGLALTSLRRHLLKSPFSASSLYRSAIEPDCSAAFSELRAGFRIGSRTGSATEKPVNGPGNRPDREPAGRLSAPVNLVNIFSRLMVGQ